MTAAVETMAWTSEKPWHKLGKEVSDKLTPEQMLKEASLNWTVSKREMAFRDSKGAWTPTKEKFMLTRDSDDQPLSVVGSVYKPAQNTDTMSFFKKFVKEGHMTMETAGSLWHGRYIWALARIKSDFKLGVSDEVLSYLLLASPHVQGRSLIIQFTPIRVVCWNTLNMALGVDLKGKGNAFRMPHTIEFNESVAEAAETVLGIGQKQMQEFKEAAQLLVKKKAAKEKVEQYFCEVLQFDPKKNDRAVKKDGTQKEPVMLPKFRAALTHAPGHNLATAEGTWWGALNAVTYVMDHDKGRDPSTALCNAWLGNKAEIKRRALDLALQRAA